MAPGKWFKRPDPFFFDVPDKDWAEFCYGSQQEGYDSHVTPRFDEYVLFDSSQVLPILLATVSHKGSRTKEQHKKVESNKEIPFSSRRPTDPRKLTFVEKLDPNHCQLDFARVPGTKDKFLIKLPATKLAKYSLFTPQKTYVRRIHSNPILSFVDSRDIHAR